MALIQADQLQGSSAGYVFVEPSDRPKCPVVGLEFRFWLRLAISQTLNDTCGRASACVTSSVSAGLPHTTNARPRSYIQNANPVATTATMTRIAEIIGSPPKMYRWKAR